MANENKESKLKLWFDDHIVENKEDLLTIGDIANRSILKNINMTFGDLSSTDAAKGCIAFYAIVFNAILKNLKEKQKSYDEFTINYAKRFFITFNGDSDDEESEKVGTFTIFMHHTTPPPLSNKSNMSDEYDDDNVKDTLTFDLAADWKIRHIDEQNEIIDEIEETALDDLGKLADIHAVKSSFITPAFCFIHDAIVSKLKLIPKERNIESGEYEINVAGIYTIGIRPDAEGNSEIYYVMSPGVRQYFKDDSQKVKFSLVD